MSLQPVSTNIVPEQTARVAHAAFTQSNLCMGLYDQLGTIFQDRDFAGLFPENGQPGLSPFRLALVTILQFLEGISDRNAADAVRGRIDCKYLLCFELENPGFDSSVLRKFRSRLLEGGTATAINILRLGAWWLGRGREQTRRSPFLALAPPNSLNLIAPN